MGRNSGLMRNYSPHNTRNIGIMAHIDAGKTTTTERILYYTGKTHKIGEVHDGAAMMDWMAQEQERGITITSAATTCFWRDHRRSTSSTPPATSTSPSRSSAACACSTGRSPCSAASAASSPSPRPSGARRTRYGVPRIAYVNKMDRIGADFYRGRRDDGRPPRRQRRCRCRSRSAARADFRGIVDLIEMNAIVYDDELGTDFEVVEIPDELAEVGRRVPAQSSSRRSPTTTTSCSEIYLEGGEITPGRTCVAAIRAGDARRSAITPVLCGSSFKNKGVQPLLDAVVDFLPSPLDVPPVDRVSRPDGTEVTRTARRRRAVRGPRLQGR